MPAPSDPFTPGPDWPVLAGNCIADLPAMPGGVQELYLAWDERALGRAAKPGDIAVVASMRAIADAIRARRAALPEWADKP